MDHGAGTPLDVGRFLAAYAAAGGVSDRYDVRPPETLGALFDRLHDPDSFDLDTVAALTAARAATARRPTVLDVDPLHDHVTVHPGDLRTSTHFTFGSHVLVLGDLDVEGVVTAAPAHAILMVAGDLRCHAIQLVRGYLFVTGNLTARDCFLGTMYGLSKVGGRIAAPLHLRDDSWLNLPIDADLDAEPSLANVDATLTLDLDAPGARALLEPVLAPGALDGDGPSLGEGHADVYALVGKIAAGSRVLR